MLSLIYEEVCDLDVDTDLDVLCTCVYVSAYIRGYDLETRCTCR